MDYQPASAPITGQRRKASAPIGAISGNGQKWRFPDDVVAYFQPVYSLTQRRFTAVEALARIQNAAGEIFAPKQFLATLDVPERRELSRMMLVAGIHLLEKLDQSGIVLDLSFNVDAGFMEDHDCSACFLGVIGSTRIKPERITLELLEGGDFLDGSVAVQRLQSIRATGAHIALDDIGSAYSSLLRLKTLPIQKIKLDQRLVSDLDADPKNLAFIQGIQFLSDGLGTTLVVEGVETPAILDAMATLGLDLVQGYALAYPMPEPDAIAFLLDPALPEATPTAPGIPRTILGAYAGYLLRRPLLYGLRHEGREMSLSAFLSRCPLASFLRAQETAEDHPILAAYTALSALENKLPPPEMEAAIRTAGKNIQHLVLEAIKAYGTGRQDP